MGLLSRVQRLRIYGAAILKAVGAVLDRRDHVGLIELSPTLGLDQSLHLAAVQGVVAELLVPSRQHRTPFLAIDLGVKESSSDMAPSRVVEDVHQDRVRHDVVTPHITSAASTSVRTCSLGNDCSAAGRTIRNGSA